MLFGPVSWTPQNSGRSSNIEGIPNWLKDSLGDDGVLPVNVDTRRGNTNSYRISVKREGFVLNLPDSGIHFLAYHTGQELFGTLLEIEEPSQVAVELAPGAVVDMIVTLPFTMISSTKESRQDLENKALKWYARIRQSIACKKAGMMDIEGFFPECVYAIEEIIPNPGHLEFVGPPNFGQFFQKKGYLPPPPDVWQQAYMGQLQHGGLVYSVDDSGEAHFGPGIQHGSSQK